MILLYLPLAAVAFGFVVAVLADLRQGLKVMTSRLLDHTTRAAMYLAGIAMLMILKQYYPQAASMVQYVAFSFAAAEILAAMATIRQALGSNPLTDSVDAENPFDVLNKK